MNNRNRTRTTPTESNEQSNPPDDNDPNQRGFNEINTSRSLQQPSDAFVINIPKVSINPRGDFFFILIKSSFIFHFSFRN